MKNNMPYNVMRHTNWEVAPRDPVSIGTAIITGLGGSTALAATTIAFGVTVAGVVGYVAVSLVTSWALSALAPKPSFGAMDSRELLVNQKDGIAPHDFVYGEVRKGGTVTYYETTGENNKFLHQIIMLAGHEVDAIGDIYINDEVVTLDGNGFVTSSPWNSKIRIKKHVGAANQTVDPDLLAESQQITSDFRGRGLAYIYVRHEFDQDVFANGLPLITAVVRGKKVFDPRTTSTAYSNNAALCVRDYISATYGLNDDQIDNTAFSAAANICDENVTLAVGGTEKRYTINGVIRASQNHGDVLQSMMTACAGSLFWGAGKWKLVVGDYVAPTKNLTLDDLRGPISLATRVNLRDQFNGVQGTFNNAAKRWLTNDYPPIKSSTFQAEDGGQETLLDLALNMTTSTASAQRLAKLTLFRGREQMTLTADFGLNAFDVEVGEIITLTNPRYGWNQKEFEVAGWTFSAGEAGDLRVSLTLRETSEAAFDWNAEEGTLIQNNTNLYNFRDVPDVSVFLSNDRVISNQQVSNNIVVSVNSSRAPEVDFIELQYAPSDEPDFKEIIVAELGKTQIKNVESGKSYTVRARAVNQLGIRGDWDYAMLETFINFAAESGIENVSVDSNSNSLSFGWDVIEDESLSHVQIRHSVSEDGSAVWPDATTDTDRVARPATNVTVPARPGTFMLRTVSKTGIVSASQTSIVIESADLPNPYTNSTVVAENPTFGGAKQNTEVVSSTIRIDQDTILVDVIDDVFQDKWETDSPFPSGNVLFAYPYVYYPDDIIGVVQAKKTNAETYSFFQDVSDSAGLWRLHYRVLPYDIPPLASFGDFPPDGYFTVSLGDSGEIPLPMSPGEHTITLNVGTPGGRVTFTRNLNVKTREESSAPNFIYMNEFELVKVPNVYTHQNNIDVGAVKQVRLTQFVKTIRHHADGNVFDSISGNWDTWAGVFDEWTGDDRPADTDVDTYYSKSNDNTTWTDWVKFRSTTVTGRYFKFKTELKSYRPHKVTPAISELEVKAEYN